MSIEGQTVGREPKHQAILLAIFHLRCIVDRVDTFLMEVKGVEGKMEKNPEPQPDGPEVMSLSEFMVNAHTRVQRILSELREELI